MCDTLVSITDDGPLFAKNSDRDPNESQVLDLVPAGDHPEGALVSATWVEIPQVAHTHAVLLSRPWWMWGAEMGANEHGVVIGNEAVFTRNPVDRDGLLGMDLLRLALERSASADEAVQVLVDLLERHGQGGSASHDHPNFRYHNSYLVADRDGARVVETAGREWAVEVVTGRGRSISNGLTIASFARSHTDPVRTRVAAARARRARTEPAACAASGVADLFAALRDHGPAGSPRWSRVNGALSAPCAHAGGLVTATQTTASWVSDLRTSVGAPQHWATATSAPCTSLFKPVDLEQAPARTWAAPAAGRFDHGAAWWRHELLHRLVLRDHSSSTARFEAERDRIERAWLAARPDSATAFAEAEAAEDRWLDDLIAAGLPDRRPAWLRRLWRKWDEAAAMPSPSTIERGAVR